MVYGQELIDRLERDIATTKQNIADRQQRINNWETDIDDCCVSQRVDERGIGLAHDKIELIKRGGCAWFPEYATLDGEIVDAKWCNTRYGYKLRAAMPDGSVVWTAADTKKGLAKVGLKRVLCKRPAWFALQSSGTGMWGAYTAEYRKFPSDVNYATGEIASAEPIEIREWEEDVD